jgi:hypothetical protein
MAIISETQPNIDSTVSAEVGWIRILNRYVVVWLWSILLGATATLSFSAITYRPDRIAYFVVLAVPIAAALYLTLIGAFYFLLRYLVGFIIPMLLVGGERSVVPGRGLADIGTAFKLFFYGLAMRMIIAFLEQFGSLVVSF